MEVESLNDLKLDPIEHQNHLWATEEEVKQDNVGGVELSYMWVDLSKDFGFFGDC